ncbi:MAG: sulfatase [Verrucomicrobia subdivision 3 bacterium]|nr:sulfatase [Limisphaerales bacterium]
MKKSVLFVVFILITLPLGNFTFGAEKKRKPNIVFFLVDDLGWADVGCYGSTFHETPNIDRLAKEGMRFDNAYATCHVCSPSRASILTGKYPARTDLTEWLGGRPERDFEMLHSAQKRISLPDEEITLAETLKQHGYATANYGKAHLSKDPKTYGFDEAITGWVRSYYHPFSPQYDKSLPAKKGDYYTDKLTDAALDFIERNKDRPFFVHLEHFAVHDPIQGRKDLVEKYQKKLASMPKRKGPEYILEPNPDGPALSVDELKALKKNDNLNLHQDKRVWWVKQQQDNVEFAGMLEATDESLGRIRAKLNELGLAENTIVIFTGDNGGMSASNQYRGIHHPRKQLDRRFASSNLPLRGAKGWNYEGGIRVPLVVHWPGETKANTTSHAVVTGTDFYPTLLEMMGLPILPRQHVDGMSFLPALKGRKYDRGAIYWHFPHYSNHGYQSPGGAIRLGNHKLLEYYEHGSVQLFDLENDLGEQNDLSKAKPEITKKLLKMLHDWRREVDAKMPQEKTAASRSKLSSTAAISSTLPVDVETFAPGWKVRDWGGPMMKPGLRTEWDGRKNVLLTHPLRQTVPCVLSRKVEVPAGKKTTLELEVTNHPKGDWKLVVLISGQEVLTKDIEETKWQRFQIDLSNYAGKKVIIELENRATGWAHEAAYWSRIKIVH